MTTLNCATAHLRGAVRKSLLLICLGSLGACESFQGQPELVINPRTATGSVEGSLGLFNAAVIGAYNSPSDEDRCVFVGTATPRCGVTQTAYRNYVVGAYLVAANDRYGEFTRRLRMQARGSSFALDVGALGFATGASIATANTANVLAAIAAGLTGTRATLNREVYFDRTVPALIGAMEASRTRLRALILEGLQRPAAEYSLEAAISDVQAYEAAASLDNAVQAITQDAAERVEDANAFAEGVRTYSGAPEEGVASVRRRMRTKLSQLRGASDTAALVQIATGLSLQPPPGADASALYSLIIDKLETDETLAGTRGFAVIVGVDPGGN